MSLAELLSGRGGHAGRLPQRLEDLRGPARGVIVLPRHLSWPGMREFDVSDDGTRRSMYGIVLSQGRRNDVARFPHPAAAARGLAPHPGISRSQAAPLVRAQVRAVPGRRQPAARIAPDARIPQARAVCQAGSMRKYVIMGVQGSGKGTQSTMLAADLDLVHISVGDILRWNVQHHTKLGAHVRRTMAAGELVGDDLVEGIVRDRLTQHDWNYGFIIDGFPRKERQG